MTLEILLRPAGKRVLVPQLQHAAEPEGSDELWYHDQGTKTVWERLDNPQQAEGITRSCTPRNP